MTSTWSHQENGGALSTTWRSPWRWRTAVCYEPGPPDYIPTLSSTSITQQKANLERVRCDCPQNGHLRSDYRCQEQSINQVRPENFDVSAVTNDNHHAEQDHGGSSEFTVKRSWRRQGVSFQYYRQRLKPLAQRPLQQRPWWRSSSWWCSISRGLQRRTGTGMLSWNKSASGKVRLISWWWS